MILSSLSFFLCLLLADRSFSLSVHDPRLSPGHLKPLGTGRPKHPIEAAIDYPSPEGMPYCLSNATCSVPKLNIVISAFEKASKLPYFIRPC